MAAGELISVRRCVGCDGREDGAVEFMLQWQKVSDMLIAASVLSIPLELLYFATRESLAPLRRALLQLGTFIVVCGINHMLNVLTYDRPGSRRVLLALTAVKMLGAVSSSAAAASLPIFIPRMLRLKVREDILRKKVRRLDRDLVTVKRRQETAWRVIRTLTQLVRDAVDPCTLRRNTVLHPAAALGLHNCAVWMPNLGACDGVLQLAHQLLPDSDDQQVFDGSTGATVSVKYPDVTDVMASERCTVLRPGSALGMASGGVPPTAGTAAATRLPILRVANFDREGSTVNTSELTTYAILVLVLPPEDHQQGSPAGWSSQDLELVDTVAEQVAVAFSHAAALEESQLIPQKLAEQQAALLQAKHELASATNARNAAHGAMRDATRRPMHPIVGLLSVMQQDAPTMRLEQRLVVDALACTSTLSSTLMDDVMERLSAMDRRDTLLSASARRLVERRPFELRSLVRNVTSIAACLSSCRGIGFSHKLEPSSVPEWVIGDDRRVFHLLLHMVDALLNRCGHHAAGRVLSFSVRSCSDIAGDDQDWIPAQARHNFSGGNHVLVKFEVGFRRAPESAPAECLPVTHRRPPRRPSYSRADMQPSVAMCKKMVQMMNGNMWSVSEPESHGETMTLVLGFHLQQSLNPHAPGSGTYRIGSSTSTVPQYNFNGLRILLADSDTMSLEVTRKLLERLGCQVVAVSSGLDCLSLLEGAGQSSFQLVVLDLDAHGAGTAAAAMSGFEVARRIREVSNSCWLLVLVALAGSGAEDGGVRDMCQRAGVNGVIQKPITLLALAAELH